MPYSTRQPTINFPKRKYLSNTEAKTTCENVRQELGPNISISKSASSNARKAFHRKDGGIVGRDKELKLLEDFLLTHSQAQTSGSLYISGLPGTGKTASVNYIIEKNQLKNSYVIVQINCTAFNSSKAVFKRICEELQLKNNEKTVKDSINAIEKYLLRKHKMTLLILDEVDQLESKSQAVLYKLFEWPSWKNSKFVLIGIANAMDLTDRHLPRLCAKVELKPTLVHFSPYTKQQIADILRNCLTHAGIEKVDRVFSPAAVELISAKVAGMCGDVRRALDLGKRVIEIAEQKSRKEDILTQEKEKNLKGQQKSLKRQAQECLHEVPEIKKITVKQLINHLNTSSENECNLSSSPEKQSKISSPLRNCLGEITPQKSNLPSPEGNILRRSPRKLKGLMDLEMVEKQENRENLEKNKKSPRKLEFEVDSKDVMSVVKSAFGSSKNFKGNSESSFPLHQKLLVCTLLLITKAEKKNLITIRRLHQVYSKICLKRGLTGVDKSGFIFLCRQVELTGVLQIGKGSGILAKVSLLWDESEIADSLKDLTMMSSILNDTSCLS